MKALCDARVALSKTWHWEGSPPSGEVVDQDGIGRRQVHNPKAKGAKYGWFLQFHHWNQCFHYVDGTFEPDNIKLKVIAARETSQVGRLPGSVLSLLPYAPPPSCPQYIIVSRQPRQLAPSYLNHPTSSHKSQSALLVLYNVTTSRSPQHQIPQLLSRLPQSWVILRMTSLPSTPFVSSRYNPPLVVPHVE